MDLPAKSKICNCLQYNGYYGCCTCDCIGTAVGHKLCWPPEESSLMIQYSSVLFKPFSWVHLCEFRDVYLLYVIQVVCFKVCGIKGIPILSLLPYCNLAYGIVIDMLHCIFLGVVKALRHLWFDKSHRNEHYSLYSEVWKCSLYMECIITHAFTFRRYHKMQTCNKSLLSISVPNTISRPPSPLEDCIC